MELRSEQRTGDSHTWAFNGDISASHDLECICTGAMRAARELGEGGNIDAVPHLSHLGLNLLLCPRLGYDLFTALGSCSSS